MEYMMEFIIAVATSVITGGLTLTGVIFTSKKQHDVTVQEIKTELALMHQEIGQLEHKQDIHNGVIERVYQLEKAVEILDERQKTANDKIDGLEKGV
nr:MAG TPA: hemolysin [Caudoviricetes sp.]